MKRVFLALVFAALFGLLFGQPSQAKAETNGIYIAPKFVMSFGNAFLGGNQIASQTGIDHYSSFTLGGALAVGYDFYPKMNIPLRAEIEYAMRGWGGNSWDVNYADVVGFDTTAKFMYSTLMANFYYDFHNSSNFTPYVGAGLGLAFIYADINVDLNNSDIHMNYASYGKNQTNFAWQVGAGVAYNFTENVAVDLAYRYVNMGYMDCGTTVDAMVDVDVDAYLYAHEIMLGLRFTF